MKSFIQLVVFLAFSALLTACGPTVKLAPELQDVRAERFAILPPMLPDDLRRERGMELERFFYALLETRGYDLLQPQIIDRYCPESSCDREMLADEYNVDGLFVITVEDFSRNSFGVGFYNTLGGNIELQTVEGKVLASAEHRESERGGVIFDSGQVISGIQDQISNSENTGDEAFNKLAEVFATQLINALPKKVQTLSTEIDSQLAIVKSSTRQIKPHVYEICVEGNVQADAYIVFNRDPSPRLRQVEGGEYCGIYRVPLNTSEIHVELRDPFGEVVRQPVSFS